MREETGYIGSLLIHGTIVGLGFLFTVLAPEAPREVSDQDPLLLEIWKGDGSERDPGIPGRERGIAEGVTTGDKQKTGLGGRTFAPLKRINADKFLKEMREAEAKAAEAASKAAAEAKHKSAETGKTASKKESLDDYIKATGKASGGKPTSGTSATGSTKGRPGIAGTAVGESGTGRGTGRDGFGRAGGRGKNGGDGGSGNAEKIFADEVRGAFSDIYIPMFREQGADMAASVDKGEVKLAVSASGLVSFGGWKVKPSDAVVARLVEAAINRMKPVRPPPGGEPMVVVVPVSGSMDDA